MAITQWTPVIENDKEKHEILIDNFTITIRFFIQEGLFQWIV